MAPPGRARSAPAPSGRASSAPYVFPSKFGPCASGQSAESNSNMLPVNLARAAAVVLVSFAVAQPRQVDRGIIMKVERSDDVGWLERITSSREYAVEVQRTSSVGMAKDLRTA